MLYSHKSLFIKVGLITGYVLWNLPGILSNSRPCWCQDESNAEEQTYQIVGVSPNGTFVLQNLDRFASILQSTAVGNRTVAVVGIVGRYRSGKSTLLNIMHRYLMCLPKSSTNQEMAMDSWLYERPDFPVCKKTFGTASTPMGFTKGIWITNQPILLPDDKGQEVAVFLIDTQGMMDNVNSQAAESPLFYLTNLLSSTLIVNTMSVLDRSFTDLVGSLTLQITTAIVKENIDEGKALQQLVFLVRDWELEQQEHEGEEPEQEESQQDYGWASGKTYFEGYFATNRAESAVIAKELEVAYENVSCFLMPKIADKPKRLKIIPSRLKPEFGPQCESFLQDLFTASHLTPKKIFGKSVNGPEFVQHVQLFANMFGNGTLQSVGDVSSLQLDLLANKKISQIMEIYRNEMRDFLADLEEISDSDLLNIHQYHYARGRTLLHNDSLLQRKHEILDKGLAAFDNSTQASYAEFARQQEEKRAALLGRLLMVGRFTVQLAKEQYRHHMDEDIAGSCYNMSELMQRHGKWKSAVQQEFLDNNTDITRKTEVYNKTLTLYDTEINLLIDHYVHKVVQDDKDLRSALSEAIANYMTFMNQSVTDFPLPHDLLEERSRSAIQRVRISFLQTSVMKSKAAPAVQKMQTILIADLQSEAGKYLQANRDEQLQLDLANERISQIIETYRKDMLDFLANLEEMSDTELRNIHQYHYAQGLASLHNDTLLQRKLKGLKSGLAAFDNSTQASYAEFSRQQEEKRVALLERLLTVGRFTVQQAKEKYRSHMDNDIANNFYNMSRLIQRHDKWKTTVQQEFLDSNTNVTRKAQVYNKTVILLETETSLLIDQYVHKVVQDDKDLRSAVTATVANYSSLMNQSVPDFPLTEDFLRERSRSAIQQARIGFLQTDVVKSKSAAAGQELQTKLADHLQSEAQKYYQANRNEKARMMMVARAAVDLAKQRYRVLMDEDVAKNFYTVAELKERHNQLKDTLKETYLDDNSEIISKRVIYNETLAVYESEIASVKNQYVSNTEQEQTHLNAVVADAKNEYSEIMDRSLSEYPLPQTVLQAKSSQAILSIRPKFFRSRILRSKPATVPYQTQLFEDIEKNSSKKYLNDNCQQIESFRNDIPSLTGILSRLGTALLSKWLPSAGDAASLATVREARADGTSAADQILSKGSVPQIFAYLVGNPWFIAIETAIAAIPKIARLVILLTNEQHDVKFQRMIQELNVVNDRLSVLEAKIVQYTTFQPIKDEYRGHLVTISNIKNKVSAMLQNTNNATKEEFLRICELHDPANIISWMKGRATGHHANILGFFLSDIIKGTEYNRTAYGFWMESIMALNTQAVMYRVMYMQISGKFDNATMASQTTHMELQVQIISDALTAADTQLRSEYSVDQLEKDIRSQLVSYHNRGLSTKSASDGLIVLLSVKYSWVKWMVALYNQECGDYDKSITELQYPFMNGTQSGMIVLKPVAKWNAVITWKSDHDIQNTPNPEREMTQIKRKVSEFTSQRTYYHEQNKPVRTWVQGIRDAGIFWHAELKRYLNSARLKWDAVVIVKEECKMDLSSNYPDSRFFFWFFDGYNCPENSEWYEVGFCGTLLRWGEAHIIVLPAEDR